MPVTINLKKAKDKAKRILRKEREPLLQKQDVEFQRALEAGADTSEIVEEKQRLRDITNLVDQTDDLQALKSLSCEKG